MAATRNLRMISIYFATGTPGLIEATTDLTVSESGLTLNKQRSYKKQYSDLSAAGKSKVDSFVSDVQAFINNQEPIV